MKLSKLKKIMACGASEMVLNNKALYNHVITIKELYEVNDKGTSELSAM